VGRATKGCGCAIAVIVVLAAAAGFIGWKFVYPRWKLRPPPASGGELQVHVLDVGPVEGDAILIISPGGKIVLVDAGDTSKSKVLLDALKRYNVQQIDYFIVTHPHPDHMGGAAAIFKAAKVLNVIDNGQGPSLSAALAPPPKSSGPVSNKQKTPPEKKPVNKKLSKTASITKFYDDYKAAVSQSGAHYEKAQPGTKYDLGAGAFLTILGPIEPLITREQMKTGGNETNANSVVARLDYGAFSMLLPGDAEEQTEHRMLSKDVNVQAKVLKLAHHGSKYASSDDFLKRVKPEIAIISCGEWNRYGHPAQAVLDRLRAANVKLYRTDLQGEITITTKGRENDVVVKTAKDFAGDLWVGRTAQKDDSSRSGFIAYGDFGPPPKKSAK
jgi:competence protein ComEC